MTSDEAVSWIRARLADWGQLPTRISAELARADRLAAAAAAQNRPDLAVKARSAAGALSTLGAVVRATTDRLTGFLSDLVKSGAAPVQLPGPYRSAYALRHPELFAGFGSHLGAAALSELAARVTAGRRGISTGGIPRCPSRAIARMRPAGMVSLPVLKRGGLEVHRLAGDELGAVPIVLGLVAIALATAMAAAYKALDNQRTALDLVERGILPPSAIAPAPGAEPPPTFGGELGKTAGQLLTVGAIALAAYLILPRLTAGAGAAARGRAAGGPDPRD